MYDIAKDPGKQYTKIADQYFRRNLCSCDRERKSSTRGMGQISSGSRDAAIYSLPISGARKERIVELWVVYKAPKLRNVGHVQTSRSKASKGASFVKSEMDAAVH